MPGVSPFSHFPTLRHTTIFEPGKPVTTLIYVRDHLQRLRLVPADGGYAIGAHVGCYHAGDPLAT